VVVIDNDPAALASVRRALSKQFDVASFQEPFDALVAMGNLQPDVVVTEIEFEGLDGVRFVERLRAIDATSHIRCIVHAKNTDLEQAALEAGATSFVGKGE